MILSLYDESGNFVKPWLDRGYDCTIVDIKHEDEVVGRLTKVGGDIRTLRLLEFNDVEFVAAFPPCTDLAVSGAGWFESKRRERPNFQVEAMELVYIARDIAEYYDVPYFIENPVSVISTLWRKPDYIFHPYEYSGYCETDTYKKKTCLWTNDKFVMPKPNFAPDIKIDSRILGYAPSPERATLRSLTPMGFAEAVFQANR